MKVSAILHSIFIRSSDVAGAINGMYESLRAGRSIVVGSNGAVNVPSFGAEVSKSDRFLWW